jgi:hypothetical protein
MGGAAADDHTTTSSDEGMGGGAALPESAPESLPRDVPHHISRRDSTKGSGGLGVDGEREGEDDLSGETEAPPMSMMERFRTGKILF